MIRRPPRSTLFPYRRSSDLQPGLLLAVGDSARVCARPGVGVRSGGCVPRDHCGVLRSEEHTSELQSLRHLVCRLLLEKKNTKKNTSATMIVLALARTHTGKA